MQNKNILTFVMMILILLKGFGLSIINKTGLDYIYLLLILSLGYNHIKLGLFYAKPILFFCAFVLLSCFYSWIMNGQSLVNVIGHSYHLFALLFFFTLYRFRLTYAEAEKTLLFVALSFCACYILQWLIYPNILFAGAENHADNLSHSYRVRLPGSMCCYFLFFYGINRYAQFKKKIFMIYAFIGFLPMIMMGFRSLVALSAVGAFLIIPFVTRSTKKTIVYCLIGAGIFMALLNTDIVQYKLDEMLQRQSDNQTFENKDYIRFLSFDYYWNQQFTKPFEKIIGGGYPTDTSSRYFINIAYETEQHGFYWVDLGIVGLSMVIGIPAVCFLIFIYLTCIWKCKEPALQYIRFTLSVVLLGSIFTSMELYRGGNILLLSLFLYIEYRYHKEKEMSKISHVLEILRKNTYNKGEKRFQGFPNF